MFAFLCKTKNWSNGMRTYRFISIFRNSKIYYYTYICRPKVALPWEPHLVHESELVAVLILCMIRTLSSSKEGKASTNLLELIFEWLEAIRMLCMVSSEDFIEHTFWHPHCHLNDIGKFYLKMMICVHARLWKCAYRAAPKNTIQVWIWRTKPNLD